MDHLVFEFGLALALVAAAALISSKLRFSSVPLLILIGMAVGPHAPKIGILDFRFINSAELIEFMARVGVLFLLFYLGLEFSISQLHDLGALLFGRVGYEGMASYWPTSLAQDDNPVVTSLMNSIPKYVFSNTLSSADWANTTLVSGEAGPAVAKLKEEDGQDLAVFGSPTFTASLLPGS